MQPSRKMREEGREKEKEKEKRKDKDKGRKENLKI